MTAPGAVVAFGIEGTVETTAFAALLAAISALEGVEAVEQLAPQSPVPELTRLGVARVSRRADAHDVADHIAGLPGIEYASVAPERQIDVRGPHPASERRPPEP